MLHRLHCENCLRGLTAKICHVSRLLQLYLSNSDALNRSAQPIEAAPLEKAQFAPKISFACQLKRSFVRQNSGQPLRGGPQTKMSGLSSLSSLWTPSELPLCPANRHDVNSASNHRCGHPSTISVEGCCSG